MKITQVQITFEDGHTEVITEATHLVAQNQGTSLEDLKVEPLEETKEPT